MSLPLVWPRGAGWQPVALGADIPPGTAAGTRLFGQELAVWRDAAGAVHVWEDRCPHRGMRLSFGFVRGDRLACLYHGWRFDTAGRCRFIPAHPALEVPATIAVTRHGTAEAAGLVWVWCGEDDAPGSPPAPVGESVPVRSVSVMAAPGRVADVLAAMAPGWSAPLATLEGEGIGVALQPLSSTQSCLHLIAIAPAGALAGARARVSLWGERLRRRLEAAAE